ncbi:rRNA maturation RNase YbeY [Methyloceanibacter sp.]|uniref:rRNA maturation RNase YbeY n=1 Tax=Methyloceanibacter sp. TaxID=1965321 RepID=UPI00207F8696|nr:rRNA maturation RNase YbeY [Methyloceanibacter sp.]GFO81011.1 MAG: endoribonuclease YbeY [Methyloceanibacter sp.]HML91318.1 rRNA maturation RNase YbeY [Methyloceanibacter sp.]
MSDDGPSPGPRQHAHVTALDVEVLRHGGAWDDTNVSDATVELAVHAALAVAPPSKAAHYEVTVVLTDDAEIGGLNRTWRGKDRPTNVLSFPAGDVPAATGLAGDPDFNGAPVPLGDIVIAFETTRAEAGEKPIPLSDHLSHLVVHGTLHLLGFDHLNDEEAEDMESLERKALASLGIADPYATDGMPQSDDEAGLAEIA